MHVYEYLAAGNFPHDVVAGFLSSVGPYTHVFGDISGTEKRVRPTKHFVLDVFCLSSLARQWG